MRRVLSHPVRVAVERGLQIMNFDILPSSVALAEAVATDGSASLRSGSSSDGDVCLLVLAVANNTDAAFEVCCEVLPYDGTPTFDTDTYTSDRDISITHLSTSDAANASGEEANAKRHKPVSIEPACVQRIVLPLPRFLLSPEVLKTSLRGKVAGWGRKMSKSEERRMRRLHWYKVFLMRSVVLRWRSAFNTRGILSLHNLVLTPQMLSLLTPDPVSVRVQVAGAQAADRYPLREFCTVSVAVQNDAQSTLDLRVELIPYQGTPSFSTGSDYCTELTHKVVLAGQLDVVMEGVQAGEQRSHCLRVLFLERGVFKFIARCQNLRNASVQWCSQPVVVSVDAYSDSLA